MNKKILQEVRKSQQQNVPCIFCGAGTRQRGLYIDRERAFGNPLTGETRCIVYAVCTGHDTQGKGFNATVKRVLMRKYN